MDGFRYWRIPAVEKRDQVSVHKRNSETNKHLPYEVVNRAI